MFWTAFTIGLFGSLHCVGMCGPIALALPHTEGHSRWIGAWRVLLYNLGRTATYVVLGLLVGMVGQGIALSGLQKWLSLAMGILLLVIALFSLPVESRLLRMPLLNRWYLLIKSGLARSLRSRSESAFFRIGLLNGFLPCGLVYLAIVGAVTYGSTLGGMQYMLFFGLGTIPLMLLTALAGQVIGLRTRRRLQMLQPVLLVALAVLLIWRGLQFSLPPDFSFWQALQAPPLCH